MAGLHFEITGGNEDLVRKLAESRRAILDSSKTAQMQGAGIENMIRLMASGAESEENFLQKIYDSTIAVNNLTKRIIDQKNVVKDVEADVRRLGEAYRIAAKNNPMFAAGKFSEYTAAKRSLEEERSALFGLTQEQAKARLSVQGLRNEYGLYRNDSGKIVAANEDIAGSLKHMVLTVAGADAIKNFISNVVDVAGNFQKMEAVLTNTLGSSSKAKEALEMLADFGAKTPFQVDELTASFVKLANQGFTPSAEEMRKLGDLASATGKSFDQLSEAILDAQTNEFERLKEFGIRASKDGDKVTFVFKEQKAVVENTASAIRDYILSLGDLEGVVGANEKISATFVGRLSNIQDKLVDQFRLFGETYKSELSLGINATAAITENLNNLIPVISGVVTAYGAYRAAVLMVNAAHRAGILYENIRLLAMYRKEMGLATAAQQSFNTASKANIYAALISLLLGLGAAVYMFSKKTNDATDAQKRLSDTSKDFQSEITKETRIAGELFNQLKKTKEGTTEYSDAKKKILDEYGKYLSGMNTEIATLKDQEGAYNAVTSAIKRNIAEKMKEKFINEGVGDSSAKQAEALKVIRERIYKDVGEDAGKTIFDNVKEALSKPDMDYQDLVKQLKRAGVQDDAFGYGKAISDAIVDFRKAEQDIKQAFKDAEDLFDPKDNKSPDIIPSSVSEEIKTVTANISSLKKEIEDLRSGKTTAEAGKTVQSAIEEKMKDLKTAEDALATLTGQTTKETTEHLKLQSDLSRSILDSELKLQSGRIAIMEDGKAKRIALAKQETRDTIAAIQKEKEEYRKGAKESKEKVDPAVIKTFDDRELAARAKEKADIARVEKEYAEEYKQRTKALTDVFLNEEQRKLSAIKTRYAEERKWADEQLRTGGMTKEEHTSYSVNINNAEQQETYRSLLDNLNDYKQKEKDIRDKWDTDINAAVEAKDAYLVAKLQEGKQKALSSLNGQMLQESEEWQQLFSDLDNLTVTQIDNLISIIEDKAKDLKLNPVDLREVTNSLNQAKQKVIELNPFKSLGDSIKTVFSSGSRDSKQSTEDIKKDWNNLAKSTEGCFEFVNDAVSSCGALKDIIGESGQQIIGMIQGVATAGIAMAAAIKTAETASVVLAAISLALQAVTALFSLFNGDKKHEKEIKDLQGQVEGLEKAYERLGRTIGNTYSNEVYALMDQQEESLRRQQALIRQQMREEEAKKKTDKDKMREYQDKLEEIDNQIEDSNRKQIEMWAGTDIQSAIDDFADALVEAYAQGEDGAKAMGDTTKKVLANAVKEALKKQLLGKALQDAVTQLGKDMEDGILSDSERRRFEDSANSAGRRFMEAMKMYDDLFKGIEETETVPAREATAKGIASISQDSANVIDGKMSSQLIYLDKTLVEVTGIREQMRFIYDLQVKGWKDVEAIRELSGKVSENTGRVAEISGRIEELSGKIETNTRSAARGIQDMKDRGLTLRK